MKRHESSLHEHTAVTWLPKEDLAALDRAEADLHVLASLLPDCRSGAVDIMNLRPGPGIYDTLLRNLVWPTLDQM